MPAPVSSSVSARSAGKHGNVKPQASPRSNKTRIVRRRGRAKDTLGSDEEIEREAGSDSESDGDQSSLDSGSESPESAHNQEPVNGRSPPSTSSSPHRLEDTVPQQTDVSTKAVIHGDDQQSFFRNLGNWSEMVADENVNGPADLPVIDFEEFDRHGLDGTSQTPPRPRKANKSAKKFTGAKSTSEEAQIPVSSETTSTKGQDEKEPSEQSFASSSRQPINGVLPKRPIGQTARQAYQQRLESDPSYVPTVGEFWGHDDRLLDKDLRSLSGWWRGRWQGRGRGRAGFDRGFSMRGRGRGGYSDRSTPVISDQQAPEGQVDTGETPKVTAEVAPIEQAWTHDGFEEMKRRDDQRRGQEQSVFQPFRGLGGFRGKVGVGRGRGTGRGGFVTSPSLRPRGGLPVVQSIDRHWFAMKPERMWTKQHDAFLHFDPSLKPRNGQGPAYRIKLSGNEPQIVRAPVPQPATSNQQSVAAPQSTSGSEDGEKVFVVRLPARKEEKLAVEDPPESETISTAVEPPIDDVFIVKPGRAEKILSAPAMIESMTQNTLASSDSSQDGKIQANSHLPSDSSALPNAKVLEQLEQLSPEPSNTQSSPRWIQTEIAVMKHTATEAESQQEPAQPRPSHAVLPPLQTAFTPVPRTSPSFGSPYTYGPALPPGIGMNQHGMPYELATGRAVYLQPPSTMYNPRPVMHSHVAPGVSFVPGHMHHHSTVSPAPEFLAHPTSHTPPINGFVDPSSGVPIFSLPRSSRVEIRAPTEQSDSKATGKLFTRRPSGLRSDSISLERATAVDEIGPRYIGDNTYSTSDVNHGEDGQASTSQQGVDAGVMYPFYPHQYYYPEAYGYPQYVDVSQVASYEMYSPDPHAGQSTVYY